MIRFIIHADHQLTLRPYLDEWAGDFADMIAVSSYDELFRSARVPLCTHVFTDLERLSTGEREDAAYFWHGLERADASLRLLNHPLRALRRYQLLRLLKEEGVNDFDVYRVDESRIPAKFPVFLRREDDHAGPETDLIESPTALANAIHEMIAQGRSTESRIVTEYCAQAGSDGVYRKYGAFYVDGVVIPRHVLFSENWMVKGSSKIMTTKLAAEERKYLVANPHAARIGEIFRLARIDYGRIDYAIVDDRIQVYEINTNPTIIHAGHTVRDEKKQRFTTALTAAFAPLAHGPGERAVASVVLEPPLKDLRARLSSRLCQLFFGRQFRAPI